MRYKTTKWTSELIIQSESDFSNLVPQIESTLTALESVYWKAMKGEAKDQDAIMTMVGSELHSEATEFCQYNGGFDCTGLMKGLAIEFIKSIFLSSEIYSLCISFGGDIYTNISMTSQLSDSKFFFSLGGHYHCLFTSGNNEVRGDHIKTPYNGLYKSTTIRDKKYQAIKMDMLSTKVYAGESTDKLAYALTQDNKLDLIINGNSGPVYCASPFFNEHEVEIRDKMISNFVNVIRPDQSPASLEYAKNPTQELRSKIYLDNMNDIRRSSALVYPSKCTDIGTLFEVGVACRYDIPIIRYDYESDTYLVLDKNWRLPDISSHIKVKTVKDAIALGYNFQDKKLTYELPEGWNDNIMLNQCFTNTKPTSEVL